jgi:hypothetical protein
LREAFDISSYASAFGTKSFSNPFGVITSADFLKNCLHSAFVISLTVVNTSAFNAESFSIEYLALKLN